MGAAETQRRDERLFYNLRLFSQRPPVQFLLDNIFLIAIAFISGGMLVWPFIRSRAAGPALSTLQATQLINSRNAVVVDVRDARGVRNGFAAGRSQHSSRQARPEDARHQEGQAPDRGLRQRKPCRQGAAQLRASGYGEVYVLAGGLAAWREAGLPIRS